jgi:preprotein translocase subunit YajC
VELLIPILLLLALTYFVLIRPQRRRQQQQTEMMTELEVGSEILTAGGVYGTVREVGEDELTVEIAPGTNVKLDKRAVAMVVPNEEPEPPEPAPATADEDSERAGVQGPEHR